MVLSFVWGESKKTYAVSSDLIWFDLDLGARGNQRDRDRERAQARKKEAKGKDDGLTPEQRRERLELSGFGLVFYCAFTFLILHVWIWGVIAETRKHSKRSRRRKQHKRRLVEVEKRLKRAPLRSSRFIGLWGFDGSFSSCGIWIIVF